MDSNPSCALNFLPPEIFEEILSYLDLITIKSLRLTSFALSKCCTGFRFRQFLRLQSIELTRPSLRSLQDLIQHPILGTAVRDLEIVATVYDQTPHVKIVKAWENKPESPDQESSTVFSRITFDPSQEEFSQAKADIAWLQTQQDIQDELSYDEAVKQLTSCLAYARRLDRVDLDAIVIQGPNNAVPTDTGETNWYPVWMRASRTYCIVMEAITMSELRLKSLNIYHQTPRCSVPLYDIATNIEMLDINKLYHTGRHIEELSLSISNRVQTGATDRPPAMPVACHEVAWYGKRGINAAYVLSLDKSHPHMNDEKLDGIARLFRCMPNLKALDIHIYSTKSISSHSILEALTHETPLALLRRLRLAGFTVSQECLIQLLSDYSDITHLALRHITLLPGGSWDSIFDHIEQKMHGLGCLHLSTLRAGNDEINLHPVWDDDSKELQLNRYSSIHYVDAKTFDSDDISKGLKFRPMPLCPSQGAPEAAHRARDEMRHYGYPWLGKKKLILNSNLGSVGLGGNSI